MEKQTISKKDTRKSINLVRVAAHRHAVATCEAKVRQLEDVATRRESDEQILRLQVAMQDTLFVTERHAHAELIQKILQHQHYRIRIRASHLNLLYWQSTTILIQVLLQIEITVLKHQCQLIWIMDNFVQPKQMRNEEEKKRSSERILDDVFVAEFFQQGDFANGSARHALLIGLEPNSLYRHHLPSFGIFCLINHSKCSLAQFLYTSEFRTTINFWRLHGGPSLRKCLK